MIRVFIVDDHAFVRRGMKQVLETALGLAVVGEAGSGKEALRLLQATPCDVVVLDLSLPDQPGLELLKQIKADRPQIPVLILTMHR
jgi:DNA-binding NarL/FixJ family response regulator